MVHVGRDLGPVLRELDRLAGLLVVIGLGVFVVGLLGGWWLSTRAVRPIEAMSRTAAGITARNLSDRIDLGNVDRELGELGAILNQMLDRLETAFTQQTRFTADASHELRTPLAVLLTQAELALSRPRTAAAYRETIATCQRAAERMRSLVEDLLTLARADAGELELKRHAIDLHALAEDQIALLTPLAENRNVRIELSGDSILVEADPSRIGQVITNLLVNAITYNRLGGSVQLETDQEGPFGLLRVRDTGPGIPEADQPHLFERFYRVDRARSRDRGGSGLGLAICQSIVEAHRGTLQFTSTEGVGTCFEVRLPSQAAEPDSSWK